MYLLKRFVTLSLSLVLVSCSLVMPTTWAKDIDATEPVTMSYAVSEAPLLKQLDNEAQKDLMTKLIPLVRGKVQVPEHLSSFDSSVYYGNSDQVSFYFNWSTPEGSSSFENEYVSVNVDGLGRIRSYQHSAYSLYSLGLVTDPISRLPKVSRVEAEAIVLKMLFNLCPDLIDQIDPVPASYEFNNGNHSFSFSRIAEPSIKVHSNNVTLSYDEARDWVSSLNCNWIDNLVVVSPKGEIVTKEYINQVFKDELGLELIYTTSTTNPHLDNLLWPMPNSETSQPYLVYRMTDNREALFTASYGELVVRDMQLARKMGIYDSYMESEIQSYDRMDRLSSAEQVAVTELEGVLSPEQLQKKMEALPNIKFTTRSFLNECRYVRDVDQRIIASMSWYLPLTAKQAEQLGYNIEDIDKLIREKGIDLSAQVRANLDAKTGELLYYAFSESYARYYSPIVEEPIEKELLSEEELHKIAQEFLQQVKPDKLASSRYNNQQLLSDKISVVMINPVFPDVFPHSFNWTRLVGEIPFLQNSMTVSVDSITGEILAYAENWQENLEFPSAEDIITREQAIDIMLNQISPQLTYIISNDYEEQFSYEATLHYYSPEVKQYSVDALSGNLVNSFTGAEFVPLGTEVFSDLANNPHKSKILDLVNLGLLPVDELGNEFKGSQVVTQAECLVFFMKLHQQYSYQQRLSFTPALQETLNNGGILDEGEQDAQASVNAAQALKWLLRIGGHGSVAGMSDIFKPIAGINKDMRGYVALGSSFGLLDISQWRAQKQMTRNDLIILIYDYLGRP